MGKEQKNVERRLKPGKIYVKIVLIAGDCGDVANKLTMDAITLGGDFFE